MRPSWAERGCSVFAITASSESGYSSPNQEEQMTSGGGGVNLCLVCRASVATKHVHYGAAAACNSCRAFFRRAAQSGNHAEFVCRANSESSERCVIRPKSWKSCQKCRFELCLEAGMRVAFVWNMEQRKIRCAQGKKFRSVTPNVSVHSMSPEEKFTHDDLAFLRHIIKQYITIDTESTVATLTPADVKTFYTAVREGRPLSYEAVETCQSIMTRSSSKFLKDILSLDIPSEDLSTLLESNNPILNSWFCSLTNLPSGESPHPFLADYLEEYRARLGAMREEVGSGGMVERLYEGTNDPNFVKAMTSSLWYDLTHSSPWACDAGLEERHKELSAREDQF